MTFKFKIMRILQAHKYFYHRAGAEMIFLDTIDGLRERGHDVAEFSVGNHKNLPSDYSAFFVNIEPELTGIKLSKKSSAKIFWHLLYSNEVENKLRALAAFTEPQVAHLHNVSRQMSASIFLTLKKLRIPIIMTVHDLQPMCPNHRMLVNHSICEKCFRHKYYNCLRYKCVEKSRSKSFAGMLEAYYYYLRGIWNLVDKFICPSKFMMNKMIEWGFKKEKMVLIHNPYNLPNEHPPLGEKIIFLGRLHEEKGIRIFMEAARNLRKFKIIVAGDGPDEEWVRKNINQYSLGNVEMAGRVQSKKWLETISQAKVVVVPTITYENCSMTILESLSFGRIVVATDRGGNNELIIPGKTGFLFKPEDTESFAKNIRLAMGLDDKSAQEMIANGRKLVKEEYNKSQYFKKLEEAYGELVKSD